MSSGLYSGVSGLALGTGLYRNVSGLWSGASGLIAGFDGGNPYSGASLYLDFLTMTAPSFDTRITFTRGSNATLTDSTGKITYAPANLLLNTATLSTQSVTTQAISYILSFKGTGSVALSGAYTGSLAGTGATDRVYLKFTSTAASLTLTVTGTVTEAQLEPVTYQTTPSTYQATTSSAYYGPRFDYDPVTLAAKGLLIEEQRTNLLTGSADFTATYWPTATNITVAADNAASPDGTTNADKLTDNTTAGVQHRLYRDYTFTSAAAHTLSVFAKRNDHRWFRLFFYDGTTSFFANFDLLNGVVGSKQASTISTITSYGNGWYRITMTATVAAAAGNVQMVMLASDDTGVPSLYTGTGTSLWLYGAQLEAGSFATSYIPTVASTVTRSADIATMTGTNFSAWYNQTAGTFVTVADTNAPAASAPFVFSASANDGTNENRISVFPETTNWRYYVNSSNVGQAAINVAGFTVGTVAKLAAAYAVNSFNMAVNGTAGTEDTSGVAPTVNALFLGRAATNTLYLNGHIRTLAYYNTRLPNSTLVSLTS